MKNYSLLGLLYILPFISYTQNYGISFSVGPSIPIGSYGSKNALKAGAEVEYNGRNLLAGYYIKKSGFALTNIFYEAAASLRIKNKLEITFIGGQQRQSLDLTNLEAYFDQYYYWQKIKVKIEHKDYLFNYFLIGLNYIIPMKSGNTEIGPLIGISYSSYPNFKVYDLNATDPSFFLTHRGVTKTLRSFTYGLKATEKYFITKQLFVCLDLSLKFSNFSYSFASQGIGLDPITAYHDNLSEKVLNIAIRAGINF